MFIKKKKSLWNMIIHFFSHAPLIFILCNRQLTETYSFYSFVRVRQVQ